MLKGKKPPMIQYQKTTSLQNQQWKLNMQFK